MGRTKFEVSDVIRRFEHRYIQQHQPHGSILGIFDDLKDCRTAVLGGHKSRCPNCKYEQISYNSCRNRHCPKCGGLEREIWIARTADVIPTTDYFHVVFTVPQSLNSLFLLYKNEMQNILFRSAWKTIEQFALNPKYLGGMTGMVSILHTWGQTLAYHPHIHCIVPGSGVDYKNRWKKGKYVDNETAFLFPVRQMAAVFRGMFLSDMSRMLKKEGIKAPTIKEKVFNIYAKQPFRGVESVIEYLGRYTHKVAISNHRIISIDNENVTFTYKDYKDHGKQKKMKLSGVEFLRRFALHFQNKGFRRIRQYGILAATKRKLLNEIREIFDQDPISKFCRGEWKEKVFQKWDKDFCQCPRCKKGRMIIVEEFEGRAPPGSFRKRRSFRR